MHTRNKPVIYCSLAVSTVFHIALIIYLSYAVSQSSVPAEKPTEGVRFRLHYNAVNEKTDNKALNKNEVRNQDTLKSVHSQRSEGSSATNSANKALPGEDKTDIKNNATESRSASKTNAEEVKTKDVKPFDSSAVIEAYISSEHVREALTKRKPANPRVFSPGLQSLLETSQKLNSRPVGKAELIEEYTSADQSILIRKGDSCLRLTENKQWGDRPQWWIVPCPHPDKTEALRLNK